MENFAKMADEEKKVFTIADIEALIRAGKGNCIHDDYYLPDLK